MTATILDGKALAKTIREEIAVEVAEFKEKRGFPPTIAVVEAGEDPASVSYARRIKRSFEGKGMGVELHVLRETASQEDMVKLVGELSADKGVHGIIIQEPLPKGMDEGAVKAALSPDKDVDGAHPLNAGRLAQAPFIDRSENAPPYFVPAAPLGGLEILKRYHIQIDGQQAVIVGANNLIGKPMAFLLVQNWATVTICDLHTSPLSEMTRRADILCSCTGVTHLIKAEMIKPGAVVIDFGFTRVGDKWMGDVDFEAAQEVAGAITPVPGGTGAVTTAMLMKNVLEAARRQVGWKE
ncbi:MAG: bifunctional 5,10-methylenetetrahydrofolate dehydrogenase/5,10-methenyltetrahydrofolate cyclohydrolase [Chloroflexota bacterium]|nr:bifunctional 5,10-methylenetetrahydrofolate dehydrogenase/5,10-methenyltetrahydrofolate cyclohydrolase [Chloroflexota bacterium]